MIEDLKNKVDIHYDQMDDQLTHLEEVLGDTLLSKKQMRNRV